MKDFKKELKALLEKYNARIEFTCADSSDLHGVYSEKIVVTMPRGEKRLSHTLNNGYGVSSYNL